MDMIPTPIGGAFSYYDDPLNSMNFLNKNTVKGQGTAGTATAPSEKAFQNHQFLLYSGIYYDASYGVTYSSEADFQSHLAGWGLLNAAGAKRKYDFANFTGTIVQFQVNP